MTALNQLWIRETNINIVVVVVVILIIQIKNKIFTNYILLLLL